MKWISYTTFLRILALSHLAKEILANNQDNQPQIALGQHIQDALVDPVTTTPELILYIMGDDVGPGDLGFNLPTAGIPRYIIRTPNIDQLRTNSALYPNVLAATVCGPSRASFLTGRPQTYSSWRGNVDTTKNYNVPYSLPLALQELGWVPILSGKFGFGDCTTSQSVKKFGFVYSLYFATHVDAHYPFPPILYTNCSRNWYPNNKKTFHDKCLRGQCTSANELALDFTLAHIEQCVLTGRKCAIFHMPTYSHVGKFSSGKFNTRLGAYPVDSYLGYPSQWGGNAMGYASMVTKFDQDIGEILDKVKTLGMENNTLTFVFGDNGAECFYTRGGPNCYSNYFGSNGGRKGRKRSMYAGGIETPIIANWPGKIFNNHSSDYPWALHDLALTTLEILKAPTEVIEKFITPQQIQEGRSVSVAKMLLQGDTYAPVRSFLFTENCESGEASCTYAAINTSDWRNTLPKLVCNTPRCVPELYDINSDHYESNNLADSPSGQAVIAQMMAKRNANRIVLT